MVVGSQVVSMIACNPQAMRFTTRLQQFGDARCSPVISPFNLQDASRTSVRVRMFLTDGRRGRGYQALGPLRHPPHPRYLSEAESDTITRDIQLNDVASHPALR